jgi:very-short-patch-repair endonuclease
VAHLVDNPDKVFEPGEGANIAPQDVDRRTMPGDLFLPLPADSSQVAAVATASKGQNFVLVGPPGTGKSQTITNIIAQCLGQGKTVLFVAEKAAALDVVQRRLKKHGLEDAVLELHSNKAERKRVLAQLGRSWDRAARFKEEDWIKVTNDLKVSRDKLNVYVSELHKTHSQGFSVYQAIGAVSGDGPDLSLTFANMNAHDQISYTHLSKLAQDVGRTHSIIAQRPPLDLIGATESFFGSEEKLVVACKELSLRTRALHQFSMSVGNLMGLVGDMETTPARMQLIFALLDRLSDDVVDLSLVPDISEAERSTALTALSRVFQDMERGKSKLSAQYDPDMLAQMPLQDLDRSWREAQTKSWPMSKVAKGKVQKMMQSFALSGTVQPSTDLSALHLMERARQQLEANHLRPVVDAGADLEALRKILTQATAFEKLMLKFGSEVQDPLDHGQARAELCGVDYGPVRSALEAWSNAAQDYATAMQNFVELGGQLPGQASLLQIETKIDEIVDNIDALNDWTKWNKISNEARQAGLAPLVDALNEGKLSTSAEAAFQSAYAIWWLPLALNASPPLREFAHWQQEDLIKTFSALDEKMTELAPKEVLRRITHGLPTRENVPKSSELGTLRHQMGMKRPNLPIRSLLAAMPECFSKLVPCVLMSPLSVAQFLPAGQAVFDVVIFDEASQISTWDAVGAIARGRQAIIVGDPKQLPPTNFFGRSDDGADGDDAIPTDLVDMPSILDEVAVVGVPTRYLNWHYRSKDESLIAFSNHNYYDGGLVTFPSPRTSGSAVEFHKVDGVYARGSGQINQLEAETIAGFVKKRLLSWLELDEASRPSLGVITFNSQQQSLILDHFDRLRREDDRLEWFFSDDREEPVIVKNLENIQGDQRDVILFSVTFGRDLAGKLTMNFGALNQDGGEKRLNVGVTRACSEMHIFASIDPDEIDISRARGRGVRDLKAFLDFAKRGADVLAEQNLGSIGDIENPFEQSIADALSVRGWEVRPQIGVSGFRVDLGIVHPDHAGVFLAGVECDGASYHSSATARDRDKTRQAVLEGLGWKILRIWSTDWFRNARSVLDRICDQLTTHLEQDREDRRRTHDLMREQSEEPLAEEPLLMIPGPDSNLGKASEHPPEQVSGDEETIFDDVSQRIATSVNVPIHNDPDRFYDRSYDAHIEEMVNTIVTRDGPIRFSALARQIANAHGWQRTGQRIQSRVSSLLGGNIREYIADASFIWPPTGPKRRLPFHGLGDRSIREVHPAEIASKVDELRIHLQHSSDPQHDLARKLGIGRVSKDARVYLESCIKWRDGTPVLEE